MLDIRYGLYLVIFSMPLYLVRFSLFGIPTTLLETMIYILFLAWLLQENSKDERFKRISLLFKNEKRLSCGIFLLFAGLFISTAYSSDLRASLGIVKGWFLDPFLFFLVFISRIKLENDMKNVLLSWVLSGFAVALISICYIFAGSLTFDGRLKAFFLSPNHLAMYLAPAFLIVFAILVHNKNFMPGYMIEKTEIWKFGNLKLRITGNGLLIMIFAMIAVPLFLTRSYGAFFAIFIAMACLAYAYKNKNINALRVCNKPKHILIAGIMLAIVLFAVYGKLSQVYDSNGRSSLHSRFMIWNASWEMIKASPIIGIGPGTFQEEYLSISGKFKEPYLEWAVPQPHNIFLAFYLQTGLTGFIGFMLLLFWIFEKGNKNGISKLIMAYILLHGLVDTTYWKNDLALMFWLVFGIASSMRINMLEKSLNKQDDKSFLD